MPFLRHIKFTFLQRINEHLQKKSRFFKKVAYLHGNLEQKTLLHGDVEQKIEGNEEGKSLSQENLCKSGIFARKIGAKLIVNAV